MASQPLDLAPAPPVFRFKGGKVLQIAVLIAVCAVIMFPFYWMILSTVQPYKYSLAYSPSLFFRGFDLSPFHKVFLGYDMGLWLWNSTQLAVMVTVICLVWSAYSPDVRSCEDGVAPVRSRIACCNSLKTA